MKLFAAFLALTLSALAQYYPPSGGGGGSGTVTNVATSNGVTGGPITTTGTVSGVNAASDGATKGVAAFNATDFSCAAGVCDVAGVVPTSVVNDTNVTGSISGKALTLGWSGTLAAARLNANVVQAITNDTNVTGSIAAQNLTLGWTGTLAAARLVNGGVFTGDATTTFPALTIGNGAITAVKMVNAGVHTGDCTTTFPNCTISAAAITAAKMVNGGVFTGDATTTFPALTIGAGAITNAKLANLVTAGTIPKGAANGLAASNITENADGSDNAGKAFTGASPAACTLSVSTWTCDLSLSLFPSFTMTAAQTLAVTNAHGGTIYHFLVTMCAAGNCALTFPGSFSAVCPPSANANIVSDITVRYDGTATFTGEPCSTTDTATVIYGPERGAPAAPTSGGALSFDSTRHTTLYQESTDSNKHIMPRTAETGDQLGLQDLSATISAPLTRTTDTLACATCATTTNGGALSATSPATISAAGVIACATCATTTNGGALSATAPETISAAGVIACATCATTTNGGALSATSPATISAAGVIACGTCATTTNGGALSAVSPITLSAAGAIGQSQFDRLVCSLTATSAGINTTETNLCNSGSLPTGTWTGTRAFVRVRIRGTNTSTAANLSTFTLRIGTGNATTDNACITNTPTSATSGTNIQFIVDFTCSIYTYGAGGTMLGSALLFNNGATGITSSATNLVWSQTTATAAIDTTAANFISMWYKSAATTTTSTFYEVAIYLATT